MYSDEKLASSYGLSSGRKNIGTCGEIHRVPPAHGRLFSSKGLRLTAVSISPERAFCTSTQISHVAIAKQETAQSRYAKRHPERVAAARANWKARNPNYAKQKAAKDRREKPAHLKAIRLKHRYRQLPSRPCPDRCENCSALFADSKTHHGACFDHDHVTGKFRGWLCNDCNRGIGQLGDSREGILRALRYFDKAELLA